MSLVEACKKLPNKINFAQNYATKQTEAGNYILTISSGLILKCKALACNIKFPVTFRFPPPPYCKKINL